MPVSARYCANMSACKKVFFQNSDFWERIVSVSRRHNFHDRIFLAYSPPPHSGFTRFLRIRVALGSWAVRLSGCDHIRIHFGKPSRHAFGSLRANSYSHLVRFDSLLTAPSRCLRACTLQAQAVPAARPEDVLAPRESPARVTPSVFAAARSACASWPSDLVSVRLLLAPFVCSCRHDSVVELRLSVRITVSSSVSSWLARGV